jgi:peptide-methionine (S)-S-oxide reductase
MDGELRNFVNGNAITPPWPAGHEVAILANGCFWGTEEDYWGLAGVHVTAVGYVGGHTQAPTYEEVCSGATGHAEAALIVFDPATIGYEELLARFWEHHDPTQLNRQGNDIGTQYRSAIFPTTPGQHELAAASKVRYQAALSAAGGGTIATEITDVDPAQGFHYAEDHHQQYLAKNPSGYRCHSATGIAYPREAA